MRQKQTTVCNRTRRRPLHVENQSLGNEQQIAQQHKVLINVVTPGLGAGERLSGIQPFSIKGFGG